MDIRYSTNPRDVKRYTTEELRQEFHITGLYEADQVKAVYSHVDRMVTLGCMPVHETVSIDKGIDVWANFGTHYFLERRELGLFNLGGNGVVICDGKEYPMGYKDCLYITMGTKEVLFRSEDSAARRPLGHDGGSDGSRGVPRVRRFQLCQRPHSLCGRRHPGLHRQAAVKERI